MISVPISAGIFFGEGQIWAFRLTRSRNPRGFRTYEFCAYTVIYISPHSVEHVLTDNNLNSCHSSVMQPPASLPLPYHQVLTEIKDSLHSPPFEYVLVKLQNLSAGDP